jgi:adenylate cyclase
MRHLLSRRRFELAALAIAFALSILHGWAERTPVADAGGDEQGHLARAVDAALRGIHVLDGRITDLQFRLRGPRPPHPDVVVAQVDERGAKRYGLWPWSRALMAQAIDNLHQAGAAAIGLDITFTDEVPDQVGEVARTTLAELEVAFAGADAPSTARLATVRGRLEQLIGDSPDQALAQSLARAPNVVQGVMLYGRRQLAEMGDKVPEHAERLEKFLIRELAGPAPGSVVEGVPLMSVKTWRLYSGQAPLRPFAEAGHGAGFINVAPDPDGTIRRMPLFAKLEGPGGLMAALELETAARYFQTKVEPLYDRELNQVVGARIARPGQPPVVVPSLFTEPHALVNFAGPSSVFQTLSLADVVDGTFDPAAVRGKAVLVGVSLVGNFDQRVTPFSEFEPGIFIHASFLSNVLQGDFLTRPVWLFFLEVLFMLLGALALGRLLPRVQFGWKLMAIASGLGMWALFDQAMFVQGFQVATLLPVANLLSCSFAVIFLSYLFADRERSKLQSAFQYRVGKKLMSQMMEHPEQFKRGGDRKELTVLFSDVRGFTSIAERMSPEALAEFINDYLTPMTGIVFEEDGTLDKYIGDALMAFWGAPVDQPDHAVRACRAALTMLEKLEELKVGWRARGRPDFDIGVGINTGAMSVGFMGSEVRGEYTVMGDAVNLASRLEGTNKEYETRILISEGTYEQVKGQFVTRLLGAVRVKGKRRPVRIYELRANGAAQGKEAEAITAFEAALDHYSNRRFEEAEAGMRRVLELWPEDPPALRYLEEIRVFKDAPPGPTWDGVYTATTK